MWHPRKRSHGGDRLPSIDGRQLTRQHPLGGGNHPIGSHGYSLGVVVVDEVACGSTIAKRGGLHETHAHLAQEVESPPPPQSNRSAPTLPSAAAANLSLNRRLPPLPPPLRAGPFLYPASFPPVHYCASPRRPAHTCAFPASSAPVMSSSPTTAGSPPHRCEEAGRDARWGCSADLPYEL